MKGTGCIQNMYVGMALAALGLVAATVAVAFLLLMMSPANQRFIRRLDWLLPVKGRWAVSLVCGAAVLVLLGGTLLLLSIGHWR